eukprot:3715334-Rhodomonas_salina.2
MVPPSAKPGDILEACDEEGNRSKVRARRVHTHAHTCTPARAHVHTRMHIHMHTCTCTCTPPHTCSRHATHTTCTQVGVPHGAVPGTLLRVPIFEKKFENASSDPKYLAQLLK